MTPNITRAHPLTGWWRKSISRLPNNHLKLPFSSILMLSADLQQVSSKITIQTSAGDSPSSQMLLAEVVSSYFSLCSLFPLILIYAYCEGRFSTLPHHVPPCSKASKAPNQWLLICTDARIGHTRTDEFDGADFHTCTCFHSINKGPS